MDAKEAFEQTVGWLRAASGWVLLVDDVSADTWDAVAGELPTEVCGGRRRLVCTTHVEELARRCFDASRRLELPGQLGLTDCLSLLKAGVARRVQDAIDAGLGAVEHFVTDQLQQLPLVSCGRLACCAKPLWRSN